jgi:hypothetical protein
MSAPAAPAAPVAQSAKGKERERPFASLMAGATAGAFEGFVTYPLDSLKTQLQFAGKPVEGVKVSFGFDCYLHDTNTLEACNTVLNSEDDIANPRDLGNVHWLLGFSDRLRCQGGCSFPEL